MLYETINNCWVERLMEFSSLSPDKTAVVAGEKRLSYKELYDGALSFAAYLESVGVKRGDRVVARASYSTEYMLVYCAVLFLRAVFVPVDKSTSVEGLKKLCKKIGCAVLVGKADDDGGPLINIDNVAALACGKTKFYSAPPRDETSHILFTTGSTGDSKGVITTNAQFCQCVDLAKALSFDENTVDYVFAPVNHYGFFALATATLSVGGTLILSQGLLGVGDLFFSLSKRGVNAVYATPSVMNFILSYADEETLSILRGRLKTICMAGEKCPFALQKRLIKEFATSKIVLFYGATETGAISAYDLSEGGAENCCVGSPFDGVTVFLEGVDNDPSRSRLAVKTPYAMVGYYGDEKTTDSILRDGKVYTDDAAYFDSGQLYIVGRLSDVIVSGGLKIDPHEVENVAKSFPKVKEALCVPKTHTVLSFVPKLIVEAEDVGALDIAKLKKYLSALLEDYKVPREITVVTAIRRNAVGKLDRKFYSEK